MICISQLSLNHKRGRHVDRFFFLNQWSGKCHFPFRSLNTTEYTIETSLYPIVFSESKGEAFSVFFFFFFVKKVKSKG